MNYLDGHLDPELIYQEEGDKQMNKIESIEAILKLDKGSFEISYYQTDPKPFRCSLNCSFGRLTYEALTIEEGINKLSEMYFLLETSNVSVTSVPF